MSAARVFVACSFELMLCLAVNIPRISMAHICKLTLWFVFNIPPIVALTIIGPINLPRHIVVSVHQVPIHLKWSNNATHPKWTLPGSHPKRWVILSAVMPHPHLAGVVAGSHCDLMIPPHVHNALSHVTKLWFPDPERKPPDPVCNVKVCTDTCGGHNATHDIDQHEAVCAVSRRQTSTVKQGASVDRGANGGLAGSDVRPLHETDRQVDVQGIDNHQLTNTPIVTAAGVAESQHGPVILIVNQCAHLANGKTIHSSAQLEAHGVTVDDDGLCDGKYDLWSALSGKR